MPLSKEKQLKIYRDEIEYLTAEIEDLQRAIDKLLEQ